MTYTRICTLLAAKRCRERGQSVKEISRSAKVSVGTVYRWLKTFV